MNRYFGKRGYYASCIVLAIFMYQGVIIYYQLMTQTLFPMIIGIKDLITGQYTPSISTQADFSQFSLAWTSLLIFFPLYIIVCKRDRSFFVKMSTFGVFAVIIQILFVVYMLFVAVFTTKFTFSLTETKQGPASDSEDLENSGIEVRESNIVMFKSNFEALAGMLAAGYYMHQLGLPIILDNKYQKNNSRDVFIGYLLVFMTYSLIGVGGYFGFSGSYFEGLPIKQNLLNMFSTKNPFATFIRLCSFLQIFSVYPLFFHVVRTQFFRILFEGEIQGLYFYLFNFIVSLPGLLLAIWYPNVGDLLGFAGAFIGFLCVYLSPAMLHLKYLWLDINHPLLLKMITNRLIE